MGWLNDGRPLGVYEVVFETTACRFVRLRTCSLHRILLRGNSSSREIAVSFKSCAQSLPMKIDGHGCCWPV